MVCKNIFQPVPDDSNQCNHSLDLCGPKEGLGAKAPPSLSSINTSAH